MDVKGVFRRVWYSSMDGMGSHTVALVYRLPSDYLKRSHGNRMLSAGAEAIGDHHSIDCITVRAQIDPSHFVFSAAGTSLDNTGNQIKSEKSVFDDDKCFINCGT